jgi:hypothetical protein
MAVQYFAEARTISRADGGKLWGIPLYAPLIFVDPATRQAVANQPDAEGRLQKQGDIYIGTLPAEIIIANHATHWSGTHWTMLRWPLPENRYARRRLLMHELFHRLQDTLGLPANDVANSHLAYGEGRILMRLEWRALAEALMREGTERRRALADALLFRAQRRRQFPNAAEQERLLELNEGLCEYTGFRLSTLPAHVLHDRAAVQLASYETTENFARSFAYASGPAYGLLLDAADNRWRGRVNAQSDLGELLRAAYRLPAGDAQNVEARIAAYDAARMIAEERARAAVRMAEEKRLRALLVDGPTLTLPVLGQFAYGFDPNGAIPLEGIGTVYRSLNVNDEWGTLTVSGAGALLVRNERGVTGVVIAAPPDPANPHAGEGWQLKLKEGFVVRPGEDGKLRVSRR